MERSGMNAPAAAALLADSGAGHTDDFPLPESLGMAREPLLHDIRHEIRNDSAAPGEDAEQETQRRASENRGRAPLPVLTCGEQVLDLGLDDVDPRLLFELHKDFRDPEQSHHEGNHSDAVGQLHDVKGKTGLSVDQIDADPGEEQADQRGHQGLLCRLLREIGDQGQAHQDEAEEFRRPELERRLGERCRQDHEGNDADGSCDERAEGGHPEGGPRSSLQSHLVPVDARHDAGRLPGDTHQDGGRRTSVHRAVVDSRKHDKRPDRRDLEAHRKEERHRSGGPDPWEDADERSEQDPQETEQEVLRRRSNRETVQDVCPHAQRVPTRNRAWLCRIGCASQ